MRILIALGLVLALGVCSALAQTGPQGGAAGTQGPYSPRGAAQSPSGYSSPTAAGPAEPDQPVLPRDPRLEGRVQAPGPEGPLGKQSGGQGPAAPLREPFILSPEEQAQLDRVLQVWEQRSAQIRTFRCKFFRMEYNAAFARTGQADQPLHIDKGEIYYAAPDKGMFRVEEPRPEHWICDGKAVYQYDYQQKCVVQRRLPPELQGKNITEGPLPFIFGARADQLKQRYWMRIVTPPDAKNQIWLEVYPKFQADAANFRRVDIILTTDTVLPFAIQLHDPGGQSRVVYQFPPENMAVNAKNLRDIFEDPFSPRVPRGWKMIDGDVPQTGAGPRRLE